MIAAERDADAREPRRQAGQVGIGPGQVLAFLPVERLVHEQRQVRSQHRLEQQDCDP